jgi:hypothetical protein
MFAREHVWRLNEINALQASIQKSLTSEPSVTRNFQRKNGPVSRPSQGLSKDIRSGAPAGLLAFLGGSLRIKADIAQEMIVQPCQHRPFVAAGNPGGHGQTRGVQDTGKAMCGGAGKNS